MKSLNKTRVIAGILFLLIGTFSVSVINTLLHPNDLPDALGDSVSLINIPEESLDRDVLGAKDNNPIFFTVNVPSRFKKDISAPNIVYSVTGGEGIEVTEGQSPSISNTGVLSLQNQTGDLALVAGNGITIDGLAITNSRGFIGTGGVTITEAANGTITVSSDAPDYTLSGWSKVGSTVVLTTVSDLVIVDAITFGNATITNGKSIKPDTDLGSDLGSNAFRFNNLYVGNINSNSSTSTAGQATFTYEALSTALTEASVLINPTAPVANGQLLGLSVAGYQRALIDEDGDLTLGYNDAISAPASDYPLSVYGHNGTRVAFIDTAGDARFEGDVDLSGGRLVFTDGIIKDSGGGILALRNASDSTYGILQANKVYSYDSVYSELFYSNNGVELRNRTTGDLMISNEAIGKILFRTSNVDAGVFDASGNLGVGIDTPTARLSIRSSSTVVADISSSGNAEALRFGTGSSASFIGHEQSSSSQIFLGTSAYASVFGTQGAYPVQFATSNTTRMTIDPSGHVGIGTDTPDFQLQVSNSDAVRLSVTNTGTNFAISQFANSTTNMKVGQNRSTVGGTFVGASAYAGVIGTSGAYPLEFATNNTINMVLASGGGLNIDLLADQVGLVVQAHSTQTANLQEWQDSGGNVLSGIQGRGTFFSDLGTVSTNLIIGLNAGNPSMSGGNNTIIGEDAGSSLTTASGMILLGADAGSLFTTTTGAIAIGADAMENSVFTTTSMNAIAIGNAAMQNSGSGGRFTVAIGTTAGRDSTGSSNVFVGNSSGLFAATGSNNVYIGSASGRNTSGSRNIIIGAGGNANFTGNISDNLYIDSADTATPLIWGDFANDVLAVNGSVGIGITDTPLSKLHVNGGVGTLSTGISFGDGDTGIYEVSDDQLYIAIAGGPSVRITSTYLDVYNNLGPRLQSEVSSSTNPVFLPNGMDQDTGLGWAGDDILSLVAGGTNGLNVIGSGNVGIGTDSPGTSLDIDQNQAGIRLSPASGAAGFDRQTKIQFQDEIDDSIDWTLAYWGNSADNLILHNSDGSSGADGSIVMFFNQLTGDVGIGDSTTPSYSLDVTGMMRATEGVVTYTKAGTISDVDFTETPIDGLMGVDSTNGRLYFRHSGAWHYVAQTAGFQIPEYETYTYDFGSSSFDTTSPLADGDFLIPFVEGRMSDGAVHGLYTSFNDVKDQLFADELSRILSLEQKVTALEAGGGLTTNPLLSSTGSIGTVAGWSDTQWTFLGSVILPTDTAGNTTVATGTDEIVVTFTRPYTSTPVVTANITTDTASAQTIADLGISYVIANTTTNGFSIVLSEPAPMNIDFSWVAILTQ